MIILVGPSRCGKSTLKTNISSYLGSERWGDYSGSGEFIYEKNIKPLVFFSGLDKIFKSKKNNQAIINFIKYKQSIIADTDNIGKVTNKIIEYSKIIIMTHIF